MAKKFTPPKKTKRFSYFVYTHPYLAVVGAFVFSIATYFIAGFTIFAGFAGSGEPSHPVEIVLAILLFLVGVSSHFYVIVRLMITMLKTKNDNKYTRKTVHAAGALFIYVAFFLWVLSLSSVRELLFGYY